jgi:hypothetical protein
MFMKLKTEGVKSTAGATVKKGGKGRVEFYAERTIDGEYLISFSDYGNYGRSRWFANAPASEEEVRSMIAQLEALLAGNSDSTKYTDEEVEAAFASQNDDAPAEEADAEEAPPPVSTDPVDDIDQLEA